MPVTRITKFVARNDKIGNLSDLLVSVLPIIKGLEGCISCKLLHAEDNPEQFIVVEEWESKAAHQASLEKIPADKLRLAMACLAGLPEADYYSEPV